MGKTKGKKKPAKPANAQKAQQEEAPPSSTIYVANLGGMDMTESKLKEIFSAHGEVVSVSLVETAKHVFGFVEFYSIPEAEASVAGMNGDSGMVVKFARNTGTSTFAPPARNAGVADDDASSSDNEDEQSEAEVEEKPETQSAVAAAPLVDLATARAAANRKYENPVETIHDLVQKATRSTSTRDYITYTEEEDELGFFISTLEVKVPAGKTIHKGEEKESKKDAKRAAAAVALRDPALHRLLAPLPKEAKVEEPKAKDLIAADDLESTASSDESGGHVASVTTRCSSTLSAKEQKKMEKAEIREKRKNAKALKAAALAAALEESNEEDCSEEGSEVESSEAADSDEDSEEGDEASSAEDSTHIDAASLTAKKAAIKAALAAKKAAKRGHNQPVTECKDKAASADRKVNRDKMSELLYTDKVKDSKLQANFGQTKFIKP